MLRTLTFCYNCTIHETTGFVPFHLTLGRVPRLPIDIMFQYVLQDDKVICQNEFVSRLKKDLSEASQMARKHSLDEQARHARLYNRKVKGSPLAVGDRVLLANRGERGKRKLADKWDSTPYDVVSVRSGINVYRIRDALTDRERVVHWNLLLPVDFLTLDVAETPASLIDSDNEDVSCGSGQDSEKRDNVDGYNRTMDWLMHSPDPEPVSVVDSPDTDPVSVGHLLDPDPVSVAHLPVPDPVSVVYLPDPTSVSMSQLTPTDDVDENPAICTRPHSVDTGHDGSVTSRYGRHVRPPKKLIHEMSHKVVNTFPVSNPVFAFFNRIFVI